VRFVARSYEDIIGSLERQHATGLETAHEFVSGKDMETLVPVLLAEGFTKITAPPWGFGSGHRIEVGRREQ
jgi:hypothetical protein